MKVGKIKKKTKNKCIRSLTQIKKQERPEWDDVSKKIKLQIFKDGFRRRFTRGNEFWV